MVQVNRNGSFQWFQNSVRSKSFRDSHSNEVCGGSPFQSFLNLFAWCNQMRRKCSESCGDEVPSGFPLKWKGSSCYVWVSRHREAWQVSSSHTECVEKLQTFPAGLLKNIKEEVSWNHMLHCAWLVPGEWHKEKNFSWKFLIISNH